MVPEPIKRWLKTNIHPTEVWFLFGALARFAAFAAWGNLIVRLIRGEEAKEDWRTLSSAAALITFSTLTSAGEAGEFTSLREAAVEMRGLVDNAAAQAEIRDQRAAERDRHALRRTCASVLVALGKDPRYVMAQLGHTHPSLTLGIYAQAMTASDEDRERLRLLVEGDDLAASVSREGDSRITARRA
jgi:integrase